MRQLPFQPALEGLRGLAVLAVLLFPINRYLAECGGDTSPRHLALMARVAAAPAATTTPANATISFPIALLQRHCGEIMRRFDYQ